MAAPRSSTHRAVLAAALGATGLVGAAYGLTAALRVQPPHSLLRLPLLPPSVWGEEFPSRVVPAAGPTRPLVGAVGVQMPAVVPWHDGEAPLQEMLRRTRSRAFVVLHDGRLVFEWYAEGIDGDARLPSWSLTKSMVSLLVGALIGRGLVSEQDLLVDLLPEMAVGDGYQRITVGHLLDMASGIDIAEVFNPLRPFVGVPRLMLSTDLPRYLRARRGLRFEPGTHAEYRSVDAQLLGLLLSRVDGRTLAQIASEELWTPMGAEADATWNLDRKGGVEKAFCCMNARPRDVARVGQLVLDGGRVGDRQVIPEAWIDRIFTPSNLPIDGWGYSAQWWHPPGGTTTCWRWGCSGSTSTSAVRRER